MTQQIHLGNGTSTLVDDADYDHLKRYDWFLSGTGYVVGAVLTEGRFRLEYMHRYITQARDGQLVDHISGDPLDNRRTNLRFATPLQNGQNKRLSSLSSTRLKGVGWHSRRHKYHTRIQRQGIRCHLGFFDDADMGRSGLRRCRQDAVWGLRGVQLSRQRDSTICGPSGGPEAQGAWLEG